MSAKKSRWVLSEVDRIMLTQHYATVPNADLAIVLGRTVEQVCAAAHRLGLHKSAHVLSAMARERTLSPGHGSHKTRFKKGEIPANKGLRRPGWSPGDMAKTQFKKGERPANWVPIGSYRINESWKPSGCLEFKFADEPGPPKARWIAVHRKLWIDAYGPVPEGHVVAFKPGRHSLKLEEITLDALECVSRAEMVLRHGIRAAPPEIRKLTQLRGALTRAINRKAKEQDDDGRRQDQQP